MSAIYDTSVLGTPSNYITFNDYSAATIFRVRQTRPMRREIREQDTNIPETTGVADFESFEGKSYFVIEGTMYPLDEDGFYRGREQLRKLANLEIEQADASSDQGYVPYKWREFNRERQLFVKVEYVDGLGEASNRGFQQPFQLYCKIKYPVIFGTTVKSATLNTANAVTNIGGSGIPIGIPFGIGGITTTGGTILPVVLPAIIGASASVGGGTVTNDGALPTYPTIQIYGPVNKPRITNATTGEYLEFDYNLAAGQAITATYDQDSIAIIGPDGNSIYNKMTTGSTLFRVKPGTNNFSLTGSSLGSTAYATVNFLDAYPMS